LINVLSLLLFFSSLFFEKKESKFFLPFFASFSHFDTKTLLFLTTQEREKKQEE